MLTTKPNHVPLNKTKNQDRVFSTYFGHTVSQHEREWEVSLNLILFRDSVRLEFLFEFEPKKRLIALINVHWKKSC